MSDNKQQRDGSFISYIAVMLGIECLPYVLGAILIVALSFWLASKGIPYL